MSLIHGSWTFCLVALIGCLAGMKEQKVKETNKREKFMDMMDMNRIFLLAGLFILSAFSTSLFLL